MVISTPVNQQGLTQLLAKAESELATLEVENEALTRQIDASQSELDAINSRQGARFQSIRMAEETVTKLRSELAAAQARARLSENTLASGDDSAKEIEKRLAKAETEISKLRAKLAKESSADDQRAAAAQRVYSQAQETLAANQRTQQATSAAREQAFADLGQVIQSAVLKKLDMLREEVEVRRQSAERAVQELDAYSFEATQRLLEWPALLGQVKPQLSYHDNTTVVIEAVVAFLDACLNTGRDAANIDTRLFSASGLGQFSDLFSLLSFDQTMYYGVLRGSGFEASLHGPLELAERRDQLSKLLTVYRESKRGA